MTNIINYIFCSASPEIYSVMMENAFLILKFAMVSRTVPKMKMRHTRIVHCSTKQVSLCPVFFTLLLAPV